MGAAFILLVDDDVAISEAITDLLADHGHEVRAVANGKEALAVLRTGARPCMILLDLMMPVMNGWQFAQEKECDPGLSQIPMCVITAAGPALAPPPDALCVLPKPFQLAQLLEIVERHC